MTVAVQPLFRPIEIGGVTVKNRVMHLATRTNLDNGGGVTDALLAYYRERAAGGVGSIVVEPLSGQAAAGRHPSAFARSNLGKRDSAAIAGLRRLATVVHEHDAVVFGQLFHGGRQHHSEVLPLLLGPSPVPCPQSGGVPHVMDEDEIWATIKGFADTATALAEAGFDGVEVHGAQGHLIQQFISGFSNHRTDSFGGPLENRTRFLREILHAIRAACGTQFVVGLRLPTTEESPGGIEIAEATEVAVAAVGWGADYLSLSAGNFNTIELHIPDRTFPEAPFAKHAAAIRQAVPGIPVVACGRVVTPENGNDLIRSGAADLVGISRPLICDPHWPRKAEGSESGDVRYCISCNQCWAEITSGRPVRCVHNAAAGRETSWGEGTLLPTASVKRVVVIGGGPAGMEAARTAAQRKHEVILFDRSDRLGGSVARAAKIPGNEEIRYVTEYLSTALINAGVEVRLGPSAEVDAARVLAEMPDTVVVATGAEHTNAALGAPPDFPVYTSKDVVDDDLSLGERAILFDEDGYYEACSTAKLIARSGTKLFIVTRFFEIGREIPKTARISILRELDDLGVELMPTTWYLRVAGRTVYVTHCYSGREHTIPNVDSLVHVGAKVAQGQLYQALKDQMRDVHCIGDAYMPRRIMDAVREGHNIGRQV